jgi:hypothetical protein
MDILAVVQVLYVSWDCLGVRTACPSMFSFVQTCFAGALPFCTTTRYAVHKQLSQVLETKAQFLITN